MNSICITKKIMKVAKYLLICSNQENTKIVRLFSPQRMDRQMMR